MGAYLSQKAHASKGTPFPLRGTLSSIECNFLSLVLPIYIGTHPAEIIRKLDRIRWRQSSLNESNLCRASKNLKKQMEKNMGKAFYPILKIKNCRKTLQS